MRRHFLTGFFGDESGQSLMEIIIGLSIGAILIGTASFGIAFTLRSTSTNQNLGAASQLTQGLLNNVQSFAGADWQNIYGLSKGSASQYFLSASSTGFISVPGSEGVIDGDVANGLIGEWKFDEASGTVAYDGTGNSNVGTLNGGVSRSTSTCRIAGCLIFDGSSGYVNIPDANTLDFGTSNFSLAAWVKFPLGGSSVWDGIVSKGFSTAAPAHTWGLDTGNPATRLFYQDVVDAGGAFNANYQFSDSTNGWHFIAVTRTSGVQYAFYKDGVSDGSQTTAQTATLTNASALQFGVASSRFASTTVDDVRLYNRALSASEVQQLYNSQAFSRHFYVENVCRTNDASGDISTTTSPCPGGTIDDPLTQKITAFTEWTAGGGLDRVNLERYLTRWGNFSVSQTDWSGGSGEEGPLTIPGSEFSSGSNVSTTPLGSFQIQNLSQQ